MGHFMGATVLLLTTFLPPIKPLASWVMMGSLAWFAWAAILWMRLPGDPS